jgi:hypothetical protein
LWLYLNKKIEKLQFGYSLFIQFHFNTYVVSSCVLLRGGGHLKKKLFLKPFPYKNAVKHNPQRTPHDFLLNPKYPRQKSCIEPQGPTPLPGLLRIMAKFSSLKKLQILIICDFQSNNQIKPSISKSFGITAFCQSCPLFNYFFILINFSV